MLEDTPTMGSISTSTYEKRRMAKDSAEFNLNDEIFVELFPDVVQVSSNFLLVFHIWLNLRCVQVKCTCLAQILFQIGVLPNMHSLPTI